MPRSLVQREELHIVAADSLAKISDLGQRDDRVPVGVGREMIDEIDDAVLESAHVEAVHHVRDAGPGVRADTSPRVHHCACAACRNAASIGACIAVVNACSVARACGSSRSVGVKTTTHATGSP